MKVIIINGPNLNLLGTREPEIYGSRSFEDYFSELKKEFPKLNLEYFQSNSEGAIIDKLQETGFSYDGIVLNAAGLTHTSVALSDAVAAIKAPVVEVHISNIHAREPFREQSYLTKNCAGMITGFGMSGYTMALYYLQNKGK